MAFAIFSMLNVARENEIKTLAIPVIGTGIFKFPTVLAARITARCLQEFAKGGKQKNLGWPGRDQFPFKKSGIYIVGVAGRSRSEVDDQA
jgi:Macro domain